MPVYKVKDYKIVNGKKVKKTKEEFNKETCGGKKIWYFKCNYKDINGNIKQKKSKKYITKTEGEIAEAKFLLNCNNVKNTNDKTIFDLYESYFFLDDQVTNKDSSLYTKEGRIRVHVLPFFYHEKDNSYDDLTVCCDIQKIKDWKNWLNKKDLGISTKKSIFNSLSSLFQYGIDKFNIEFNPLALVGNFREKNDKVEEDEPVRFLTAEEYNLFINEVDDDFKIIFHFLYEVGCRKGELQSLTWNDIDFKTSKIKINKTLSTKNISGGIKITNTKNKKLRYVDISTKLNDELKQLYDKVCKLDGFDKTWFVFGGLKYISASTLDRRKNEVYKSLAKKGIIIPNLTVHEFRHSSASYMISNNIPIEIIAYRLGDTVETVRRVYAHLFPDVQKDVKGLFNNL